MTRLGVGVVLAGLVAAALAEPALLRCQDRTCGLNVAPESANAWQARMMGAKERLSPCDYDAVPSLDFFRTEFGAPAEPFAFTVGSNGWRRLWGSTGTDHAVPAARFGRGWEKMPAAHYRLQMNVEQSVPETSWRLVRHVRYGYRKTSEQSFNVKGNGLFTLELGVITLSAQNAANGIELQCLTGGAHVKVSGLTIAPYTYDVTWRRTFTLKEKPFRAGVTFDGFSTHVLTVNGRVVRRGSGLMGRVLQKVDLTDCLRAGENELTVTANFAESYGPTRQFRIEAFAVDADGTTHVFAGGPEWTWRHGNGPWCAPTVGGRVGFDYLPNGTRISDSSVPLHAGALDPRPESGSPYPLFPSSSAVLWTCRLPPALKAAALDADVTEALTGKPVLRKTFAPDVAGCVRADFGMLNPGAYLVAWTLRGGTSRVDRVETEMVSIGRLALPEHDLPDMKRATEASKRLVQRIDCTRTDMGETNLLDHSRWWGDPRLNVGRVARLASGVYRETGSTSGDLMAFKIDVGELGKPHLLEFDYPDDGERMIYCAIAEPMPVNFCNNMFPVGSRAWPNASGAVRTGGLMPVSGEKKTVQMLFFPASRNATVYFENGLEGARAAVSEIRVYQADGLPAVRLPETNRLYGNHDERPLHHPWGAFVNPHIHEYDGEYKWRFWTAAYAATANRIRQLRFCGMNMAIEGGYMYSFGFPSEDGASRDEGMDFDFNRLILMMYRANGIHAFLSYEYTCAPDVTRSGARSVGDRENWAGTARPADQVDRYGRQITGHGEAVNCFHPAVWQSMTNVLGELYRRYGGLGAVDGVVAQTGWLWQPSFGCIAHDVTADEVGYDDDTVEAFERDTGIRLGLAAKGGARFAQRYEKLMAGPYRDAWRRWRTAAVKRKLDAMRAIVRSGREKWDFYVSPSLERGGVEAAFASGTGTPAERDGFFRNALVSSACDLSLFDGADDGAKLLLKADYGKELQLADFGVMFNRGTREICRRFDALYFAPVGLNEHIGTRVPLAKVWWWRSNGVAVFETKPAGENALYDLVGVVADGAPRRFFHTWLDVNIPTAFADEERRAAIGFYLVPEGPREAFEAIRGVQAWRVGNDVQLVNSTPYRLEGVLRSRFVTALDRATGRRLSGTSPVVLPPFGLMTVRTRFPQWTLSGDFHFSAADAAAIDAQARTLADVRLAPMLPASFAARLKAAACPYARAVLQRDFEAFDAVDRTFGKAALADYVNGRVPLPKAPAVDAPYLVWRAGETNLGVQARFPKSALHNEGDVKFMRLKPGDAFSLAAAGDRRFPSGRRIYTVRVRVHGQGGFCQVFGPWRSRFDIRVGKGTFLPGAVHWKAEGSVYQQLDVEPRYARANDRWTTLTVDADPEGEARAYADGFLLGRLELMRLHGEHYGDSGISFWGRFFSSDAEACVDFASLALSPMPAEADPNASR